MFKRTAVSTALAMAFGGLLMGSAMSTLAQERALERVEITGSNIKRVDSEGATPVKVVTRKEIEKIGAASVGELLNTLTTMAGSDDSTFSLDPTSSGFQGAAMTGFDNGDTLVLLNGKRLSKYPVGGTSVDLNSIPMAIIERIEVLRDGASATYGSDAIAGVVNVITRKNFQGASIGVGYGESSRGDGKRDRVSLTGGYGNIDSDGFNVVASFEKSKIGEILNRDREITRSADLRPYGLADDRLPTSPEPNLLLTGLSDDDPGLYRPIRPCAAPLPPEGVSVESAQPGKVCAFDPNSTTLLQPKVVSTSFFVAGNVRLGSELNLKTEYVRKEKESGNYLNPQPISNLVSKTDSRNPTVGTPIAQDVIWFFRSTDPRLFRQKNIELKSDRLLAEVSGTFGNYDISADISRAKSSYKETGSGYFVNSLFTRAVQRGDIDPFTPGKLDPNFLVTLTASPVRVAETQNDIASAKMSGDLFSTEAGSVMFAAGVSYNEEKYTNTPDPLQAGGLLRGDPRLAFVNAERKNAAGFGEVVLPLTKSLEVTGALRVDKYSDFGNTVNPKLAMKFQAAPEVLVRGSFGKGFRAPSLEDLYATDVSGFPNVTDFQGCTLLNIPSDKCASKQVFTLTTSNSSLLPEKSEAITMGMVLQPERDLMMTFDFVSIQKKNAVESLSAQTILDNPNVSVPGVGQLRDLVRRLPNGQLVPDATVPVITAPTANLASLKTDTLDIGLQWSVPVLGVKTTLGNSLTYLISRTKSPLPGLPEAEYRGLAGFPEWRNVFQFSADVANWNFTSYVRTVSGFYDVDEPSALFPTTRRVDSWTTLDAVLSYSGFYGKNSRIDFGVKNLLDKDPPLSTARNTSNKIDFVHSAVGRYFQVGATIGF